MRDNIFMRSGAEGTAAGDLGLTYGSPRLLVRSGNLSVNLDAPGEFSAGVKVIQDSDPVWNATLA